ncbi:DeoR/GlpR family DNA-binding transcription regulator [Companilactobacillus halodurans]|uniref:DeoR/GlpR transcriptional regulator n=1 Tax=Companilactobacillus halodurans TaxID=2584183 RepID=A0A5P0ZX92_9LACO|nr:DeoR/GlpR family DNA-binding transcription regulator [Companilactobacillus halodurans]MQS97659.1 DeoR/GlpR transcriptional regulator [Companilactobacillus halodurans]
MQKERLDLILKTLQEKNTLTLKDIIDLTGTSRDTARRDIVKLTENNLVERNYGSISLPNTFQKLDNYLKRSDDNIDDKQELAKQAAIFTNHASQVYLDVSTTVEFMPRYIINSNLFAITNSLDTADQLIRHAPCKSRILGGNLDPEKRCVTGTMPCLDMEHYNFDYAFISSVGIDESGIYYAYEDDIDYKKKIRQQAKKVVLLLDHSKVNVKHNFKVLNLNQIDYIITNGELPQKLENKLIKSKTQMIYM